MPPVCTSVRISNTINSEGLVLMRPSVISMFNDEGLSTTSGLLNPEPQTPNLRNPRTGTRNMQDPMSLYAPTFV